MAYGAINEAKDVQKVEEQEYGVGKSVKTTRLTSCICVVGRASNDTVLVIHLVLIGREDDALDDAAADEVGKILSDHSVAPDRACMVGQTDYWGPGQPPGYNHLLEVLKQPGEDRNLKTHDGRAVSFDFDAGATYGFKLSVIED